MIPKEVWYDVIYVDTTEKKPFPRTRSFKLRGTAQHFFNQLDSSRFDKHLILYEKTLLDYCQSEQSKNKYKEF